MLMNNTNAVSYTHLDVYKRQAQGYIENVVVKATEMCRSC